MPLSMRRGSRQKPLGEEKVKVTERIGNDTNLSSRVGQSNPSPFETITPSAEVNNHAEVKAPTETASAKTTSAPSLPIAPIIIAAASSVTTVAGAVLATNTPKLNVTLFQATTDSLVFQIETEKSKIEVPSLINEDEKTEADREAAEEVFYFAYLAEFPQERFEVLDTPFVEFHGLEPNSPYTLTVTKNKDVVYSASYYTAKDTSYADIEVMSYENEQLSFRVFQETIYPFVSVNVFSAGGKTHFNVDQTEKEAFYENILIPGNETVFISVKYRDQGLGYTSVEPYEPYEPVEPDQSDTSSSSGESSQEQPPIEPFVEARLFAYSYGAALFEIEQYDLGENDTLIAYLEEMPEIKVDATGLRYVYFEEMEAEAEYHLHIELNGDDFFTESYYFKENELRVGIDIAEFTTNGTLTFFTYAEQFENISISVVSGSGINYYNASQEESQTVHVVHNLNLEEDLYILMYDEYGNGMVFQKLMEPSEPISPVDVSLFKATDTSLSFEFLLNGYGTYSAYIEEVPTYAVALEDPFTLATFEGLEGENSYTLDIVDSDGTLVYSETYSTTIADPSLAHINPISFSEEGDLTFEFINSNPELEPVIEIRDCYNQVYFKEVSQLEYITVANIPTDRPVYIMAWIGDQGAEYCRVDYRDGEISDPSGSDPSDIFVEVELLCYYSNTALIHFGVSGIGSNDSVVAYFDDDSTKYDISDITHLFVSGLEENREYKLHVEVNGSEYYQSSMWFTPSSVNDISIELLNYDASGDLSFRVTQSQDRTINVCVIDDQGTTYDYSMMSSTNQEFVVNVSTSRPLYILVMDEKGEETYCFYYLPSPSDEPGGQGNTIQDLTLNLFYAHDTSIALECRKSGTGSYRIVLDGIEYAIASDYAIIEFDGLEPEKEYHFEASDFNGNVLYDVIYYTKSDYDMTANISLESYTQDGTLSGYFSVSGYGVVSILNEEGEVIASETIENAGDIPLTFYNIPIGNTYYVTITDGDGNGKAFTTVSYPL